MLVPENDRLTAKECLEHPWFTVDASKLSSCSISLKTFERLSAYSNSVLFRQCVQFLIAYRCNLDEDIAKFRKLFFKIGKNNNGYLTIEEAKEFFSAYIANEADLIKLFNAMDLDGNGIVYWNEFLSTVITTSIVNREENLREIYYFFDRTRKGYFDGEDFK